MAGQNFTPAGVDLQAKGFRDYIKQLDEIDKKQRAAFDKEFKGTGKSYNDVTKAAKQYEQELARVEKAEQKAAQQRKLHNAALAAGAALLAREVIQFSAENVNLAREQAKAEAQLEQALRSTGFAAGFNARELKALASELQGTTNFGDEATIRAEALLLTFTNIRETLPDATRIVLDMSEALDQGLKESSIQVGKALNEPITGVTALRRVGVQFSDEQERVIKSLAETGRLAEAQQLILAELNKEFGGSAAAAREADGGFVALSNSFGDLREQLGFLVTDLNQASGFTENLAKNIDFLGSSIQSTRVNLGFGDLEEQVKAAEFELNRLIDTQKRLEEGQPAFTGPGTSVGRLLFAAQPDELEAPIEAARQKLADLEAQLNAQQAEEEATAKANADLADSYDDVADATDDASNATKAYANAINQAQDIQRSFARQQEDNARQLARQQADAARDLARENEDAARDLARQAAEIERKRLESIADLNEQFNEDLMNLESDAAKDAERQREDDHRQRIRAQEDLHRQLRQAEERFNLSRLQSQRRFTLDDRRLRAEGDILALQELRENFDLQQQEERENFDLQQRQQKESGEAQAERQSEDIERRIEEQQAGLEEQRRQLQEAFNDNLAEIEAGTAEERVRLQEAEQQRLEDQRIALERETEDQQIALARQNEDQRIALERRLEDLGFALAQQADVTQAGAAEIANRLEEVFGVEGTAEIILGGFFERSRSGFQDLIDDIEDDVERLQQLTGAAPSDVLGPANPTSPARIPGFQHGGSFTVGGAGGPDSQVVAFRATPGERVSIETPQQFSMPAPIAALQSTLNVQMSGGFNITGADGAGQATVEAALNQMVDEFSEVVQILARRS